MKNLIKRPLVINWGTNHSQNIQLSKRNHIKKTKNFQTFANSRKMNFSGNYHKRHLVLTSNILSDPHIGINFIYHPKKIRSKSDEYYENYCKNNNFGRFIFPIPYFFSLEDLCTEKRPKNVILGQFPNQTSGDNV